MSDTNQTGSSHWERQTIQKILMEHIVEQRRSRRWGIFFKLLLAILVIIILFLTFVNTELPQPVNTSQDHTAFIQIYGDIEANDKNDADTIRESLKNAFQAKRAKGIILRINSPGGSPVQARMIYEEIRYLRKKYPDIKVYATIEELGTSAAYLIACAADEIYADKTSLVGSIGVRLDSFGFVDAMKKVGVERRLYTAGKFKGALDPFLPRNPEEDAFVDQQLQLVHQTFIQNVREGRGARLKDSPDLYTGQFWVGQDALNLGLIDGFGDAYSVARNVIHVENLVDYTQSTNLLDRLANRLGASISYGIRRMIMY